MAKQIRIPDALYDKVRKLAEKEKRSISNMASVLLEAALKK